MDGFIADVEIEIDEQALGHTLEALVDDQTMVRIYDLLAKKCDPYVPYLYGPLSTVIEITPQYLRYVQPYAHWQYVGISPSGKPFNYTKSTHKNATSEWDKAMMREHGDEFTQQVKQLLLLRARELYG